MKLLKVLLFAYLYMYWLCLVELLHMPCFVHIFLIMYLIMQIKTIIIKFLFQCLIIENSVLMYTEIRLDS